ncbi:MAG: hypothetical protein APF84_09145 [Gracilibacter sp. BRH_c7a]|nr:MAG: hypothetical protein APF84_09145 [Gracilibacter sp. BRH_c7a]
MPKDLRVLILIILSILLIGCSNIQNNEGSNNASENQAEQAERNLTTENSNEIVAPESEIVDSQYVKINDYVSPDNTWGVRVYAKMFANGLPPGFEFILLNKGKEQRFSQPIQFSREDLMLTEPVIWTTNNRVVINGEWVFDKSNSRLSRMDPKLDWVYTYSFSPDKKYLARCEKSDNNSQFGMEIRLFDLEDLSSKTLYFFPGAKVWTSGISFSIAWTDNESFVFDGNLDEQPTVFRYSLTSEKVETFRLKAWSPKTFPDSNFVSFIPIANYFRHAEEIIVQDKESGAEIRIPAQGILYWLDRNRFILMYGSEITAYSIKKDLTYSRKPINEHSATPVLIDVKDNYLQIKYLKFNDYYPFSIEEETIKLDS